MHAHCTAKTSPPMSRAGDVTARRAITDYRLMQPPSDRASSCQTSKDCLLQETLKRVSGFASFGPMRRVTAADRGSVAYTIPIRETGSNTVVHVTPMGKVSHAHRAHAMNHTCSDTHSNAVITHTGDVSTTTHTVYVRAYKAIDQGQEIFACYGTEAGDWIL